MINAILKGFLSFLSKIASIILSPIDSLISNLFPDMAVALNSFNTMLNSYVGNSLTWFFSLIPPITRSLLLIALTFLIGYYSFIWTYSLLIKVWSIIQKIKVW